MQRSSISERPKKDDSELLTKFRANSCPQASASASGPLGAGIRPMHTASICSSPLRRRACVNSSLPVEVEAIAREVLSRVVERSRKDNEVVGGPCARSGFFYTFRPAPIRQALCPETVRPNALAPSPRRSDVPWKVRIATGSPRAPTRNCHQLRSLRTATLSPPASD